MAGQIDRALDHYNQAVAIDSDSPWARHNRAEIFHIQGAWGLALDDLQKALETTRDFDRTPAYLTRGAVLQAMGDVRSARADFERVITSAGRRRVDPGRAPEQGEARLRRRGDGSGPRRIRRPGRRRPVRRPCQAGPGTARAPARPDRPGRSRPRPHCSGIRRPAGSARDSGSRARVLALRAIARLAVDRPDEAEADASLAFRLEASPSHERLWNRTLLAIGRELDLSVDDPEDFASLPGGDIALVGRPPQGGGETPGGRRRHRAPGHSALRSGPRS